jgi:hypothetical protein
MRKFLDKGLANFGGAQLFGRGARPLPTNSRKQKRQVNCYHTCCGARFALGPKCCASVDWERQCVPSPIYMTRRNGRTGITEANLYLGINFTKHKHYVGPAEKACERESSRGCCAKHQHLPFQDT